MLADLNMPEMRGDTAARVLREKGFTMPIVAITGLFPATLPRWCNVGVDFAANVLTSDVESCLKSGMDEILSKPGPHFCQMLFTEWRCPHHMLPFRSQEFGAARGLREAHHEAQVDRSSFVQSREPWHREIGSRKYQQ